MKHATVWLLTLGLAGCDIKMPFSDSGGAGMCLDDFLELMAMDRDVLEAEAAERGISTGAFLDEVIDGGLSVADFLFDCSASDALSELGDGTGGTFVQVGSVDELVSTLVSVTEQDKDKSQDIAFMIDGTGSMSNDIEGVRDRLDDILEGLDPDEDRVSIAWYRDKHVDDPWYRRNNRGMMAPDSAQLKNFLAGIDAKGGGDLPESLYDGAFKTLEEVDWEARRRVLVVITDAGAAERDTHTAEDVVGLASDESVEIVPILVGL